MISFRMVALAAVAFAVSSFGSLAMAGCGGGRTGLISRLHAKKSCGGGGLLAKLHARKGSGCSAATTSCEPAPASSCGCSDSNMGGTVTSDWGTTGTVIVSGSAPCNNCGTTLDSGSISSGSANPPVPGNVYSSPASAVPVAPATPATPAVPTAPAVPAVPGSASDVPKA
jgi:hypothetical protein